ncbi:hypothetical protein GVAV_001731 [Gurleya vavrai]
MIQVFLINKNIQCSRPIDDLQNELSFNIDVKKYSKLFNNKQIRNLAKARIEFQKKLTKCDTFTDFKSYFEFSNDTIQSSNYISAIKTIEADIYTNFSGLFLLFDFKNLIRRCFIEFFQICVEEKCANDDIKLELYIKKAKILSSSVAAKIKNSKNLYRYIEMHKNNKKELQKNIHPNLAMKFVKEYEKNNGLHFSKFIIDMKTKLFKFFISKYTLNSISGTTHLDNIRSKQAKLFEVIKDEKLYNYICIVIDDKEENVVFKNEQNEIHCKQITSNELNVERKALDLNSNYIIFNSFCTVIIKESDFEIYFVDERYYKMVVLLTKTFAFSFDPEILLEKKDFDEFEGLLFDKIVNTLFPGFLITSEIL